MRRDPQISVLMAVRNEERYVREAIDSILRQSERHFEFLIVDDQSTDLTGEYVAHASTEDVRVRVLQGGGDGLARALNLGLEAARGEYVARMDADDVAMPDRLRYQLAYMEDHPEVAVLGTGVSFLDDSRDTGRTMIYPTEPKKVRRALKRSCILAHPSVMFRREVIARTGGYRVGFVAAQDYDLWLRVSRYGEIANLPETLLKYRLHAGQVSLTRLVDQGICALAARTSAALQRKGKPDPFVDGAPASAEVLLAAGVPQAEIDRAIIAAFISRIAQDLEIGRSAEAAVAVASLERWSADSGAGRGHYARSKLRLLEAYRQWNAGLHLRGAILGFREVALCPSLVRDVFSALLG